MSWVCGTGEEWVDGSGLDYDGYACLESDAWVWSLIGIGILGVGLVGFYEITQFFASALFLVSHYPAFCPWIKSCKCSSNERVKTLLTLGVSFSL